jgi:hypothetical protein
MMSPGEQRAAGRILLALDSSLRSQAALHAATRLAMEQRAELVALFVEDPNLARLAGLPFARELDRGCALERPLDSERMDRSFRAQAEQIRSALEQSARPLAVKVSLRVVRGQFIREAFSAAAEHDLMVLARMGGAILARPTRLVTRRAPLTASAGVSRLQAPVAVVYDGSAAGGRALAVAANLARSDRRPVLVVTAASGDADAAMKADAATLLGRFTDRVRFVCLPGHDPDALPGVINREGCEVLVLGRGVREQDPASMHRLVERVDCSVVLVP